MSRYRGIQTDIWDNEWFVEQDKDIQFYWLFLLTNQWTEHSGIYRMRKGIDALYCHGDRTVTARWRDTLTNAEKAYFHENWVYIPTYVEKQATPNIPMWKSMLDQIKNAPPKFIQDWLKRYESEIPEDCSDRIDTVKARCGHGEGTVVLQSDNENVNVNGNVNENSNENASDSSSQESHNEIQPQQQDPMGYMPCDDSEQGVVEDALAVYQDVWNKPGYKLPRNLPNEIMERHRDYVDRPDIDDGRPVEYVIRKSKRLFDDGNKWYGDNCGMRSLMQDWIFAKIMEAQEPKSNTDKNEVSDLIKRASKNRESK